MSAQIRDLTRQQPSVRASSGLVKISYGVHVLTAAIAGKSVGEVRQALKEPLNIDPRALALVNGRDASTFLVLQEGDQLEFVRLAGEKGRRPGAGSGPGGAGNHGAAPAFVLSWI
ncbi:MAG: hypothetical protein ACLPT6_09905 [Desulfobaccales bacterium]